MAKHRPPTLSVRQRTPSEASALKDIRALGYTTEDIRQMAESGEIVSARPSGKLVVNVQTYKDENQKLRYRLQKTGED